MLKVRSNSLRPVLVGFAIAMLMAGRPAAAAPETPQPSAAYAVDRIIVIFRTAPSETDLEAFQARHFLSLVDYIGLDYPDRAGWYVFRIEDRMDASLVRGLLHADPAVCLAELIPQGQRNATTGDPPGQEDVPDCVPLPSPPPTLLPMPTDLDSASQGGLLGTPTGSPGNGDPTLGVIALLAGAALVLGVTLLGVSRSSHHQPAKVARRQRKV